MSFSGAYSQTFNKNTDLLLANFDLLPDDDDVHAAAALGCMLKHEDFEGVNYYAVAGAYGSQEPNSGGSYTFINTVAPEFFTTLFGNENSKWTNADSDWNGSVTRVTAEVVEVLNAGGNVFVQEAGQSDFTYDVCHAAMDAGVSAATIASNVIVVQHSNWNINNTTTAKKNWIRGGNVVYVKIEDGNYDNTSPNYKDGDNTQWLTDAMSEDNPNEYAQVYWTMANEICENWTVYNNSAISAGGVDFSDCSENWYIFNWGTKGMTVEDFWNTYVTNTIGDVDFDPTVQFVTPSDKASILIGEDLPVEVSATDDGSIANVKLYLNNVLVSTKTNAPYTWDSDAALQNMAEGDYTLKAIAEDNTGNTSEVSINVSVAAPNNAGVGPEVGEHWVVCEVENTTSPLGDWELRKDGDADYFNGASNDQYLEFTGNVASGNGNDRSPLTYTFTAPKTAQYELLMRFHQNLDNGAGGEYAGDYCNDVYITMEGNFTSGTAALSEEELRTEQKFFGKGRNWGVGYRVTMYTSDGEKNYPGRYNLIEGETYTLTIAGRSKQTCVDYWLFVDNSEINDMPTAQEDMYTMLHSKYRPAEVGTDPVAVTGVAVSPTSTTLTAVGATKSLIATISPSNATNKAVNWKSSDDEIATINTNGVVTAVANGTVTITATTVDGNHVGNSSITVSIGTGECATFAKIEGEDYDDMLGVETGNTVDTDGGLNVKNINSGDWTMYSNIDLTCAQNVSARVASGRVGGNIEVHIDAVDGLLIGTITQGTTGGWQNWVTASANLTDASGVHDVYLVFTGETGALFNFNWFEFSADDIVLSNEERDSDVNLSFFPNPTSSLVHLSKESNFEVTTLLGQTVTSGNGMTIDLEGQPKGIYLIQVEGRSFKIIKK